MSLSTYSPSALRRFRAVFAPMRTDRFHAMQGVSYNEVQQC